MIEAAITSCLCCWKEFPESISNGGNFTTIFVDLKNQCDVIGLVMEQCSDPAYDKYIVDRGLSSLIEPRQSDSTSSPPSFASPADVEENDNNNDNDESTDEDEIILLLMTKWHTRIY